MLLFLNRTLDHMLNLNFNLQLQLLGEFGIKELTTFQKRVRYKK